MFPKTFATCFLLLLLLPMLSLGQQVSPPDYRAEIARHRAHEDSIFKFDEHSPLKAEAKASFKGLEYFPVDESYRVKARFVRNTQETVFIMPTTGTRNPEYVKYGELHFRLKGQPLKLSVYQNQELKKQPKYMTYLFIPFTDATTGQETYETGRYLDFTIPMGTDSVWLDFNKAYNPYCAYGEGYSCPIPPKENKLPVGIEAGVRNYERVTSKAVPTEVGLGEEAMPEFPGGLSALMKFMNSKFEMPAMAKKAGVTGTVEFSFVVKADGTLDNFQIVKSLRPDVDVMVLHAAKQMPLWKPGMQNGRAVNVKYNMPFKVTSR
ncbi:TonB family protein [Rufibacter latericius]|uniref:TonB family protein n=1 Tax=Rufibacter latericius TaxID=2487040 RepID=A0A3M9MKZ0_9BACT|nr:TonB family protein [Rufibacter latericius]RNI26204.1 TonB family protein [Rufibacter latericius]